MAVGVTGVLNFAPCVLSVPDSVMVRKADLSTELQILTYHQRRGPGYEPVAIVGGHAPAQ